MSRQRWLEGNRGREIRDSFQALAMGRIATWGIPTQITEDLVMAGELQAIQMFTVTQGSNQPGHVPRAVLRNVAEQAFSFAHNADVSGSV